ncbi:hypothetical protein VOLCADRAFT_101542 [Volvox carteri f. nagariensis]|uniref:RWD domain-containing protein n=1 Tax=Volvox carteri f. nagariensis TaxID=3068 RepID=D8UMZ4_VOLCA|nr:uncharacterized protein VOLCADRAFT_101542 [Volvox carteri f. nagariensis]EFJ38905.1 hypothetical protein VOLCADRAFT_101542 [Volvox carteri f. nagariensis]|eukprot:XP_002960030.1 hypothetical protein VOLCADRAFT_101542 [Volvox carteri f. nagariensis]
MGDPAVQEAMASDRASEPREHNRAAAAATAMPLVDGNGVDPCSVTRAVSSGSENVSSASSEPASASAPASAAVRGTEGEVNAGAAGPGPGPSSTCARVPFGASVQFLSPIRVTLTLPTGYPAAEPPAVELASLWLTAAQAAVLVSELQQQWRASGGGVPILFLWLDWLKSEALPYLGVRQELVLSASESAAAAAAWPGGAAAAAAAGGGTPEGLALSLLRYSARREEEKFNESNIRAKLPV